MKASLTALAAVAWLVSATLWGWAASRSLPPLPAPNFSMTHEAYKPFDAALRGAARRNTYAAAVAMVAAALQCLALVVR
jgi:hypothetical protein